MIISGALDLTEKVKRHISLMIYFKYQHIINISYDIMTAQYNLKYEIQVYNLFCNFIISTPIEDDGMWKQVRVASWIW